MVVFLHALHCAVGHQCKVHWPCVASCVVAQGKLRPLVCFSCLTGVLFIFVFLSTKSLMRLISYGNGQPVASTRPNLHISFSLRAARGLDSLISYGRPTRRANANSLHGWHCLDAATLPTCLLERDGRTTQHAPCVMGQWRTWFTCWPHAPSQSRFGRPSLLDTTCNRTSPLQQTQTRLRNGWSRPAYYRHRRRNNGAPWSSLYGGRHGTNATPESSGTNTRR